jgi:hypothetical protein
MSDRLTRTQITRRGTCSDRAFERAVYSWYGGSEDSAAKNIGYSMVITLEVVK